MAPSGQREQLGILGGLRTLREQLPVQRDASGDAVQVAQVGEQQQARFRAAAGQLAGLLAHATQQPGVRLNIILQLQGKKIGSGDEVRDILKKIRIGDHLKITVLRGDQVLKGEITVVSAP